jgi:hypothetical protein
MHYREFVDDDDAMAYDDADRWPTLWVQLTWRYGMC